MKALFHTFLFLCFLISSNAAFSQVRSYTTKQEPLPCLNKTFSVVVHIVRDTLGNLNASQANISNRFAELNEAFKPLCVDFEICETRIIDNFQYDNIENPDEWEEMLVKEHQPNRINVFIVFSSTLDFPAECGAATPNGIQELETGGILLNKLGCLAPGSDALIHLMGHYFGLLHTFEGNGTELVDGSNCTTEGDLICDTPADPYTPPVDPVLGGYLDRMVPCRFVYENTDANNAYYRPDVGNFMSYYPDDCRCGFTYEQYLKMANTYLASLPKMW